MEKNQYVQRDLKSLIRELKSGNIDLATGTRYVKGFKGVLYGRIRNGTVLYYTKKDGKIILLAHSDKNNQDTIIDFLKGIGYKK